MGNMRIHISRKILGKQQYGAEMHRMYRQALHTILQKVKKKIANNRALGAVVCYF